MPGYLTTHVLDTARGCPAAGLRIDLYAISGGGDDVGHGGGNGGGSGRAHLRQLVTNADGRTDTPILPESAFATGIYELVFHAGDYLDACGVPVETPRFLDLIPIRFGLSGATHYHVPLLLSPFGYSTYRGS